MSFTCGVGESGMGESGRERVDGREWKEESEWEGVDGREWMGESGERAWMLVNIQGVYMTTSIYEEYI
jgi:hypothetical protein